MDSGVQENEALYNCDDQVAYVNTTKSKNGKPSNGTNGGAVENGSSPTRKLKCTKKRLLKICLLATFVPILILGIAVGTYLLYIRLTYYSPPTTSSNATEVLSMLSGLNKTNTSQINNMVAPPWSDCGSALGKVEGFFIDECKPYMGEKRCSLPLEKDGNIQVIFRLHANVTVTAPTFDACGKAIYTGTPCRNQPFSKPDPCVNSGLTCPLEGGQLYVYHNYGGVHQKDLPITLSFDTYADTYFRLRDPITKKLVFCVRMPSVIDVEPFD